MKNLAIITARSGSKGLPGKNIKLLNGKPLIAYTIEAAITSGLFDEVFVSTDSFEYAQIAETFGAVSYPLRKQELSMDTSSSCDVLLDVINDIKPGYTNFCLLQPTSPLRDAQHIQEAFNIFMKQEANAVISMVQMDKSPNIINTINDNGTIDGFLKVDSAKYARQNEVNYIPNGAIFWVNCDYYNKYTDFYKENAYPYIMDKKSSLDIDDIFDFKLCQIMLDSVN